MEIKQNWIVNVVKENPTFPFIVIDNWYTPNEEKAIWNAKAKEVKEAKDDVAVDE